MTFRDAGFLEPNDRALIAHIRGRHADSFAFIERLNHLAMSVLLVETPRMPEELYVATLYARAVTLFQGAVLMAERGMAAEARTLVRGCAETAIALGCARLDRSFLEKLDEDFDKHRIALANDLLRLPEDDRHVSAEQRADLRAMIAEVSSEYTPPHPVRIKWADAAVTASMMDLYLTVYRQTSADAAHAGLKALERHVATNASGDIAGLRFFPDVEGAGETLSAAIASLLHATEAKLHNLSNATADAELLALSREWSAFIGSSDEPKPAEA